MIKELSSPVMLRALEPEDLELMYTIENDRSLWDVSETCTPISKFALRQYLSTQPQDAFQAGEVRLVIEDCASGKSIGLIDLTGISVLDRRAEIGIALLRSERGKGKGLAALKAMEDYAKKNLHLRLLYCKVSEYYNEISKSLFESNSYVQIAVLPEWHYRNGEYENLLLFQKKL